MMDCPHCWEIRVPQCEDCADIKIEPVEFSAEEGWFKFVAHRQFAAALEHAA